MVGRFVEQQDVGLGCQRAGNGGAADLATRKVVWLFIAVEAECLQQQSWPMTVAVRSEVGAGIVEDCREAREVRLLRQIADGCTGLRDARAAICLDVSGGNLEQCRFTRSVAAHEANPVAGADFEIGTVEQRLGAKGDVDVGQGEQRSGH